MVAKSKDKPGAKKAPAANNATKKVQKAVARKVAAETTSLSKTAKLFQVRYNQAVRLPKEFEFSGVSEVEIIKDGNQLILKPVRKSWESFLEVPQADDNFLVEREDLIEQDRVNFGGGDE